MTTELIELLLAASADGPVPTTLFVTVCESPDAGDLDDLVHETGTLVALRDAVLAATPEPEDAGRLVLLLGTSDTSSTIPLGVEAGAHWLREEGSRALTGLAVAASFVPAQVYHPYLESAGFLYAADSPRGVILAHDRTFARNSHGSSGWSHSYVTRTVQRLLQQAEDALMALKGQPVQNLQDALNTIDAACRACPALQASSVTMNHETATNILHVEMALYFFGEISITVGVSF